MTYEDAVVFAAEAVLEERERAARVARTHYHRMVPGDDACYMDVCYSISREILQGEGK